MRKYKYKECKNLYLLTFNFTNGYKKPLLD